MREVGRLLLLLQVGLLGLLTVALISFNPRPELLLQVGLFDLPRGPAGLLVAGALWTGVGLAWASCALRLLLLRLQLRRLRREKAALSEELQRARSLPLRIASDPGPRGLTP
jgi:hypothetical protein